MVDISPHCHGVGCRSADLIKAHFIPRAFARQIKKSSGGSNTTASELRFTRSLQHGLYGDAILCADCDGFLGRKYDDPAFNLINSLNVMAFSAPTFEIPNVDCDLLCTFILSVLWRCSISSRYELSNINLIGYTNPARMVLWHAGPISNLRAYRVLCQRYYPRPGVKALYSLPIRAAFQLEGSEWRGYVFPLVGFRFMVIIDPRPLPSQYDPYILNGSDTLRGSFVDFPETYEAGQARALLDFPHFHHKQM
jgi:hypothetical protein